jgi:hypothetical protein
MRRQAACVWALALSLSAPVYAADPLKDDPQARQFFEFGAQAYAKGQYLLAIDAFERAYALTERPGLLFSLAQAHQRQFRTSAEESHLAKAIDSYRRYLARIGSGAGRQTEAQTSLNALLAVAERLHPESRTAPARAQVFGRLLLSSTTPNVTVTVNGDAVDSLPTALELPAERYKIVASAKGFQPQTQELTVVAGSAVPLNLALAPLPARLDVRGTPGAEVLVDGRAMGWLPLAPLEVPPGEHWVSVRKPGKKTRTVLARADRGNVAHVDLALETTFQRSATWVTLGGAAVAAGLGGTFALLSLSHDSKAKDLEAQRQSGGRFTVDQANELNDQVAARDRFRTYAIVGGVSALALAGTAAALYFSDTPGVPPTPDARQRDARQPLQLTPLTGSVWGLSASGRF